MFLLMMIAVGGNIFYTNKVDRDNRSNWCDLIVSLDERNKLLPNPNPDQVQFFRLIHELRERLDCPEGTIR